MSFSFCALSHHVLLRVSVVRLVSERRSGHHPPHRAVSLSNCDICCTPPENRGKTAGVLRHRVHWTQQALPSSRLVGIAPTSRSLSPLASPLSDRDVMLLPSVAPRG